jgi:hypothetical protein
MQSESGQKLPIHLPYPLNELAHVARHIDILWFRGLTVATSVCGILYKILYPHETPMWMVMAWNAIFIGINLLHIALILSERRGVHFTEEEKELYATVFSQLSPIEFMKLLRLARWENAPTGATLAVQGQILSDLLLIYSGGISVQQDGKTIAQRRDGTFIGEVSMVNEGVASATVVTSEATRYLSWPKSELKALLQRNQSLNQGIQAVIASDLTKKLLNR